MRSSILLTGLPAVLYALFEGQTPPRSLRRLRRLRRRPAHPSFDPCGSFLGPGLRTRDIFEVRGASEVDLEATMFESTDGVIDAA
jgi:hypothetical protein